jgi:hypothetical protein
MAMGSTSPFRPTGTVAISASTASASVQLAGGGETVVVTNLAASLAYIRFGGDPSVAASSSDMPVLPNARAMLSVNSLISYAAATLVTGTGSVLFSRGDGSFI